jgi:hypothetical protein
MKLPPLLLAGSLATNAVILGLFAWQPVLSPPAFRNFFARNFSAGDPAGAAAGRSGQAAVPAATGTSAWAAYRSDDFPTLIARLRAAGFPPNVIRDILRTQVSARYNPRLTALLEPDPNVPYWRAPPSFFGDAKRQEAINQIQRERAKALRELLADESLATGDVTAAQRRQFGNLSPGKIDALQRIEDDYTEMMSQVRAGMQGVTLPEDREKLALLAREKQADLAAVLSPEELADYTMRTSGITSLLRNRLDAFNPSESEFRAIFQTQQALNEKFPPNYSGGIISGSGDMQQRQDAQRELDAQLRATLGEARYAEYSRSTSNEFQQLSRLAQRDNLPAAAAVQAYQVREQVAAASNHILDDAALSLEQKRAALQTLAQTTRTQLLNTLGPTSGPAYVKLADAWLTNVERGSAVTFTTSGGSISLTTSNGVPAMVMLGNNNVSYRRLPGGSPTPRRDTLIIGP